MVGQIKGKVERKVGREEKEKMEEGEDAEEEEDKDEEKLSRNTWPGETASPKFYCSNLSITSKCKSLNLSLVTT